MLRVAAAALVLAALSAPLPLARAHDAVALASEDGDAADPLSGGEFLCRLCGRTLFHAHDAAPAASLSGPRVVGVVPEPLLGPGGVQHVLTKSRGGQLPCAVFSAPADGAVALPGAETRPPVLEGYKQRLATCGRCGTPLGWRFDRIGAPPVADAGSGRARGAVGAGRGAREPKRPTVAELAASGAVPWITSAEAAAQLAHLATSPCLVLNRGWWTYDVCPGRSVEQHHEATRWSLGAFDDGHRFERTVGSSTAYHSSQFFHGGQRCDETGKGRSSEVQYLCCSDLDRLAPYISSVEEPGLCHYVFRVCAPSLCAAHAAAEAAEAEARAEAARVAEAAAATAAAATAAEAAAEAAAAAAAGGGCVAGEEGGACSVGEGDGGACEAAGEGGACGASSVPSPPPPPPPPPLDVFWLASWERLLPTGGAEYRALSAGGPLADLGPVHVAI